MNSAQIRLLAIACFVLFASPFVRAQDQPPQPAYRTALPNLQADQSQPTDVNGQELAPDTRSLAGVQTVTLGVPALERSYWQPSFNVNAEGDSNPLSSPGVHSWSSPSEWTTILGGLNLQDVRGRSNFEMDYFGGGIVSNDPAIEGGIIQEAQVSERFSGRRTEVALLDQTMYIPETSFGYGGLSELTLPGGAQLGIQSSLVPNETILSARGQRLISTSLVEVDTLLTPNATFSMAGGYALLHYFNDDDFNFNNAIGQAGVSLQVSRHDTIAIIYRFDQYRFPFQDYTLLGHTGELDYARRVTGRMAFEIDAGAEWAIFRLPGAPPSSTTWPNRVYWAGDASFSYELRRTLLSLSYDHSISGGSGVLTGALTDTVSAGVSSQLTRTFHGYLNVGFGRNSQLSVVSISTGATNPTFDYLFGTVGITHPLGREMTWSVGYSTQYQQASQPYCVTGVCGTSILRQQVSLGFNLHPRPFAID